MKIRIYKYDEQCRVTWQNDVKILDSWWIATVEEWFNDVVPIEEADRPWRDGKMHVDRCFEWVGSGSFRRYNTGVTTASHTDEKTKYRRLTRRNTIVSDCPFVVVVHTLTGPDEGQHVVIAREVHKGELGKEPFLNTPRFIRGPRGWGWVKLVDLARFASMTADEVWRHFSRFAGSGGMTVLFARRDAAAAIAQDAEDLTWRTHIMAPLTDGLYFTTPEAERVDIWVPAGWARRVLYLLKFGYKPEGSELEAAAKSLKIALEGLQTDRAQRNKEGTMSEREYTIEDEARDEEVAVRQQMEQERIAERDARGMVVDTDDDCPDCGHTHRECVCNKEAS